jgi:anti-anti-sigma factor
MGSEDLLTIQVEVRNGVTRLGLSGELDLATAPELDVELEQAERVPAVDAIMLDLRGLTFLDGSGLSVILAAHDRASQNGHQLLVVGTRPPARLVFEVTGAMSVLEHEEAVSILARFMAGEYRPIPDGQVGEAHA